MNAIPYEMTTLSGKAAVFVRGMVEFVDQRGDGTKLRDAQKAGMDAVEALGETISIPYVSKLSKTLQTSDILKKERKGKGYIVTRGDVFNDFIQYLAESDYGVGVEPEVSEGDIRMRSAMLDHMTDVGHVRIEAEHPLDKRAYQVLIDKFKAGQYDMVFVHRDITLVEPNEHPDEHPRVFPVKTIHASVANQK